MTEDPDAKLTEHARFKLSANSAITLSSSTSDTRTTILNVLNDLSEDKPNTTRVEETGHYISSIGDNRVVWTRRDGKILVLTIFAPTA